VDDLLASLCITISHKTLSLHQIAAAEHLCVPNVWPAPDLQVDFCDLVSISLH
jgi:hypothetical protein